MADSDKIRTILVHLKSITEQYEKHVRKKGEKFNIFSIIGREHYEVQIHSAIIAELLNPNGLHGQGDVFLKYFLNSEKLVGEYNEILKCERIQVSKELSIPNNTGRIDILIQANGTSIAIENKIYAPDLENQLERYYEHTKYPVIYLTLDGSKPEEYTLGDLPVDKVICLSYADDIVSWLETCIKEVPLFPQIREILYQYQTLVKSLTGQPIDQEYVMETANIFFEDKNYKIIPTLEKSILEFKVQLQLKFWEDLNNKLEKEKYNTNYINAKSETKSIEDIKKIIESFYAPNTRKSEDYGIMINPCSDMQSNYAVRVGLGYSGLVYWGIVPSKFEDDNIRDNVTQILKKSQHDVRKDEGWYGYIYPTYNNYYYDFTFEEKSLKFIHKMTSEADKVVGELATKIEDAIKEFQKDELDQKV